VALSCGCCWRWGLAMKSGIVVQIKTGESIKSHHTAAAHGTSSQRTVLSRSQSQSRGPAHGTLRPSTFGLPLGVRYVALRV